MDAIKAEELRKKATLLKWAIAGVLETSRESYIDNPGQQLLPLEELASDIEQALIEAETAQCTAEVAAR